MMRFLAVLLLLIGCGCSRNNRGDHLDTMECSYRFVASDGREKSGSRQLKTGEPDSNGTMQELLAGLDHETGTITLRIVLPDVMVTEIQAIIVDGQEEGTVRNFTEFDGKRKLTLEQVFVHGVRHGRSTAYYPTGEVQYEGAWKRGTKDGVWTFNYPNGKRAQILTYENDLPSGGCRVFDKNGREICTGNYCEGTPKDGTFLKSALTISEAISNRIPVLKTTIARYAGGTKIEEVEETISIELPHLP